MTEDLKALAQRMKNAAHYAPLGGSNLDRFYVFCSPANVTALIEGFEAEIELYQKQMEIIKKTLANHAAVHVNILRGDIALTKEQAWHIAGGDQRVEELREQLAISNKALEIVYEQMEATGSPSQWKSKAREQLKQCQEGK